jgi:ATP-binding protein involved in chromosome partitioning
MRIAIPVADGRLAMHFGHCQGFALVDVDPKARAILATKVLVAPEHQPGAFPRWLAEQGAKVVIAGGMGGSARDLFARSGITVLTGAPQRAPEALALAYLEGTLVTGVNVCDH